MIVQVIQAMILIQVRKDNNENNVDIGIICFISNKTVCSLGSVDTFPVSSFVFTTPAVQQSSSATQINQNAMILFTTILAIESQYHIGYSDKSNYQAALLALEGDLLGVDLNDDDTRFLKPIKRGGIWSLILIGLPILIKIRWF